MDTEKYEVHPGITGYTPQEPLYDVHPEIAGVAATTQQPQQEQEAQSESVDHEHHDHEESDEPVQEIETKNTAVKQSWSELRNAKERAEYERDLLLKQLAHYESIQQTAKSGSAPKQQEQEEDYSINGNPEDLADFKQLYKVDKKVAKVDKKYDERIRQLEEQLIESRIRNQYPDFSEVVSSTNIDRLRAQYPEIAANLNANTDLYTKAVSAYTMIKKLGILPQEDLYQADRARAQKNAAKPRPLASIAPQKADSPLSHANAFANGLTPELSKQLHREMMEAMKKA